MGYNVISILPLLRKFATDESPSPVKLEMGLQKISIVCSKLFSKLAFTVSPTVK
jgi:hypothetical protein